MYDGVSTLDFSNIYMCTYIIKHFSKKDFLSFHGKSLRSNVDVLLCILEKRYCSIYVVYATSYFILFERILFPFVKIQRVQVHLLMSHLMWAIHFSVALFII